MADRSFLADFLRVRREQIQPEQVGLIRDANRRVRGLRREEVARLADISPDYYLRLEQGRNHLPSEQVLAALTRALGLDEDEHSYLLRVARVHASPKRSDFEPPRVSEAAARILRQWVHTPAYISDRNHDLLAMNGPAAVMTPFAEPGTNVLMDLFDTEAHAASHEDWTRTATRMVSALRFHAIPGDPRLEAIVGRLSVTSRAFRRMWAKHDVRPLTSDIALVPVAPIGLVQLRSQTLEITGEGGQFLTTFFADKGSPGETAILHLVADAGPRSEVKFFVPQFPETRDPVTVSAN